MSVDTQTVTLEGNGWINVRELRLAGAAAPLAVEWTDQDSWRVTLPLHSGANDFAIEAYDFQQRLTASDAITVTTSFVAPNPLDHLRVTEVHYHPADPTAAELAIDPSLEDDDFEFLEIKNIGTGTVDLTGVQILDDVSFNFTGSAVTSLGPGQHVLVVESSTGFAARYDTGGLLVAGEFTGNLSNGGGTLELRDALGQTIQLFTYDDNGPGWHPTTDGSGPSLVIVDPLAAVSTWNDPASWRPSHVSGGSPGADDVLPPSTVAGRHLFYNQSFFDGNNAAATAGDDAAIDTTKSALLPGGTGSFANYSSYSLGLNGVMVDIAGPHGTITAADFAVKVGNNNTPGAWAAGPAPTSLTLRAGAGAGGSDRYTLIWANNAIQKQWAQITLLANANTNLAANDVFYFGNAIGDVGNTSANAIVSAADEAIIRVNFTTGFGTVPVTSPFDINKDRFVRTSDAAISRINQTTAFSALRLIVVPAASAESYVSRANTRQSALDLALVGLSDPTGGQQGAWLDLAVRSRARRRGA
jgi:hypothetical protein